MSLTPNRRPPARCQRGRGGARPARSPLAGRARPRSAPAPRRPRGRSPPARHASETRASNASIASSPVGSRDERLARLELADLGRQHPNRPRSRTAGWRSPGRSARPRGRHAQADPLPIPSRSRVYLRHRERVSEVSVAMTAALRQLVGDRQRDRPRAGADVEHRRRLAPRSPARPAARSPGAGSAPAGRPRARSGESPCGRGCRRPARARRAAGPSPRTHAPPPRSTPASGVGGEPRAVEAGRLGEQQLGVEPRRSRPRPPRARRSPTASASRDGPGDGGAHRPSAVCASSRARFSSAASAEVNSLRSPSRTSSRLCAVSLIRWSVTRPCGKL